MQMSQTVDVKRGPACGLCARRLRRVALLAWAPVLALLLLAAPGLARHALAQSAITSPAPGATISGDVPVMGTAVIDPFQKYELHYKLEPSGNDAFVYFDGSTSPVTNGQLGIWRAAGLPGGTYSLRLRVVKQDGNYAEFFSPNITLGAAAVVTPTPTITPTATTPTPTFTPAPSATPNVGAVQQPQLDQPATPTPAAVAAAPVDPAAVQPADANAAVQAGDLAAGQSSGATTADTSIVDPAETTSATRELGSALSLDRLRGEFWRGIRLSAAVFLAALALYAGKRTFDWARRRYG